MTKPGFDDLSGRRVLVTGASSGIGAAVARAFGACGAKVAIQYHRGEANAKAVAADIEASGGEAVVLQADLSEPEAASALAGEATLRLGGLDVLVNNAGHMVERRPFAQSDDALYDAIFDLNLRGVLALTRAAIPPLRASGTGAILNTSSMAARTGGGPGSTLYAASKGALNTLTIGLARELGPDRIRVNCISPGPILTPFHDGMTTPEALDKVKTQIPLGRIGTVNDCVGAFLFLASNKLSGYISGAVLEIGGGRV